MNIEIKIWLYIILVSEKMLFCLTGSLDNNYFAKKVDTSVSTFLGKVYF